MAAAADRLGRTQPQLSRLIADLEGEVGFPLFLREHRRLAPTPRAHRFYGEVLRALNGLDDIKRVGEELRLESEAQLRVMAPPYACYTVLPEALARYRRIYENGRFSLEMVTRSTIGSWVSFHPFDIGIASLPFDAPSIVVTPLAQVPSVVVMPPGHPLAAKDVVDAVDLQSYPFVALNAFTLLRRQLDKALEQTDVTLNIVAETDTGLAACSLVAEGVGITIVDRLWIDAMPPDRVVHRPWRPGVLSSFGLIRPSATPPSEPAQMLASILQDIFEARYR